VASTYCPKTYLGLVNGKHKYVVKNCDTGAEVIMDLDRQYQIGDCPDCPDPIITGDPGGGAAEEESE
jgi:hypothetical protein